MRHRRGAFFPRISPRGSNVVPGGRSGRLSIAILQGQKDPQLAWPARRRLPDEVVHEVPSDDAPAVARGLLLGVEVPRAVTAGRDGGSSAHSGPRLRAPAATQPIAATPRARSGILVV